MTNTKYDKDTLDIRDLLGEAFYGTIEADSSEITVEDIQKDLINAVIEKDAIDADQTKLDARKARLKKEEERLAKVLQDKKTNIGFDCLAPSPKETTHYSRTSKNDEDAEDKELFDYLRDNDMGGIIKKVVDKRTLNSTIRKHVEAGNELPDRLFNTYDTLTLQIKGRKEFLAKYYAGMYNGELMINTLKGA